MNYVFLGLYFFFTTIALIVYFFLGRRVFDKVYIKRVEERYKECKDKMDRNYKLITAVYALSVMLALFWKDTLMYLFDEWIIPYAIVVFVVNVLLPMIAINKTRGFETNRFNTDKLMEYYASGVYADELQIFLSCMVAPFFGFSGFFFKCSITI